jgi:conserved hypothetical protein, YceG family
MDKDNPQKDNKNGAAGQSEPKHLPVRRAARRPSQGAPREDLLRETKAEQPSAQQNNQPNRTQQTQRSEQDTARQLQRQRSDTERMQISNPRDQLRRMQVDLDTEIDKTATGKSSALTHKREDQNLAARKPGAPLPREIMYETPEVDPEVLRRRAASQNHTTSMQSIAKPKPAAGNETTEICLPSAVHTAAHLPQKINKSVQGTNIKRSFKRADDFLPKQSINNQNDNGIAENADFDETQNETQKRGGALTSLLKAIIYIVFILTISGFISYFAISVGNDVFAFVKSAEEVTIDVPEYATIDNIADILSQKGIIRYPFIFKFYAMLRKDDGAFVAGEYKVSPSMNYDQLRDALKGTVEERKQISITIPEGYTVDEIIDLFVNTYGMGTREGFVDAIQNADFDYWFLKDLKVKDGRKYRLEGYLYPDTYYFFTDWSEKNILIKLLDNFELKFDESYKERCDELGMTVDELITLASMIEMEGKFTYEYGSISAVFHNRLDNPSVTNGKLESDATIQYILPERHEELTADDLAINSPYNTYMYAGLPVGPITNPTLNAIHSAMYPDDVDYYYFIAQPNGQTLFAETYADHLKNKQIVADEKAAANAG